MKKPDRRTPDRHLAQGMDVALTIALFVVVGVLLDNVLGTAPVCTIVLIVLSAVGQFIRMKYTYDATMEQLEAERRSAAGARAAARATGERTP
jgi:F0F1-type ATP synthase assembly protein I